MSELPYFPLYIDKYEAATGHLSLEEDGAYVRLLRLCWRSPNCTIPADPVWITRKMRVDMETFERVVKPVLDEFFTLRRKRYLQKRLLTEFGKAKQSFDDHSKAGKRGAEAKALKKNESDGSPASTERKPRLSTKTQTQTHISKTKQKPGWMDVANEFERATGLNQGPNIVALSMVQTWLDQGYDAETIIAAGKRVAASPSYSPQAIRSMNYFADAVAEEHRRRSSNGGPTGNFEAEKALKFARDSTARWTHERWEIALKSFKSGEHWPVKYQGPPPDDEGFIGPVDLRQK